MSKKEDRMTSDSNSGPWADLIGNLTGSAAGHYGVHAKDSVENVSETQAPFDPQHSPLRRRQGDEAAEANRPTTLPDDGGDDNL